MRKPAIGLVVLWAVVGLATLVHHQRYNKLWHDNAQCEGRLDEAEGILKAHNWNDGGAR